MTKSFLFISLIISLNSCSYLSVKEKSTRDKKTNLYFAQGTEMLVKKDYSRALEYLLEAQKLSPGDSEVHNNLGMAYFFKKRTEKAKQHLERSIELNPKNSDARNNYASILFREKNYQEAKKQYLAVKNDLIYPHQYRTNYNLALIEEVEGNQDKMKSNNDCSYLKDSSWSLKVIVHQHMKQMLVIEPGQGFEETH